MNKKKVASLLLVASIFSQITFSSITSVHAIEIPTSIEHSLNEQVDEIMEQLTKNNVAAEREEVKNVLFGRTMPIEKTEEIIKKVVSLGLNNAPGIVGTFGGKIGQPLMDMLWPYANQNYLWEKIRAEVEKIVGNKIADSRFQQVKNKLAGLKKATQEYIDWIEAANEGKDVTDTMKNKLDSLDSLFTSELVQIGDIQNKVYDVEFLPIYVQAANIHLMLLRDVVLNLERTNHTQDEINEYKLELNNKIKEYTNHCKNTYKKAIEKREKDALTVYKDNTAHDYVLNKGQMVPARRKNYVVKLENFMQRYVLDYVALWGYMDSNQYNKNVDVELSREIYSDIYGFQQNVTNFKNINFSRGGYTEGDYLGEFVAADIWNWTRIDAITPGYNRGVGSNYQPYVRVGGSGGEAAALRVRNPNENPIEGVNVTTFGRETPHAMKFFFKDGSTFDAGRYRHPTYTSDRKMHGEIVKYEGHKLSSINVLGSSNLRGLEGISGVVFGFRPENLTPENNLKEGKISVFSSQKYITRDSFTTQREFLLGGNAMKTNTKDANMTYKFNSPKEGLYRVRYKVAAKTNSIISLSNAGQKIKDTTVNKTTDGTLGNYDTPYKVVDGPVVKLKNGKNDIKIGNANGGEFSISNIEFVPVNNEEVKELTPIKDRFDFDKTLNNNDIVDTNVTNNIKTDQSVFFVDHNRYVTYKINAPKDGTYTINLEHSSNQQGLSNYKLLNLQNNKYNDGNKMELVKGENRIKVTPKEIKQEDLSIENVSLIDDWIDNEGKVYTTTFLKGEGVRKEGSKVILENENSYADFKVNDARNWTYANVKINGKGDFNITNLANNKAGVGPNNHITLNGDGKDIIRVTGKKRSGYSIRGLKISMHYENIVGYN
ncbi:insecticidal delta-endotoxin Cry8Ea1 family protein [Clostridium oceanicum]|uniref:Crystaline entomocidal protoxin n=1 Tax=Clostridium oceanicum TaxID=1543 RepID=A0ABP3UXR7_9CLOT